MPHSQNDNAITRESPEEDTIESCSASTESELSNQPYQVPATPVFENSNQHSVPFVEPEQNATSHKALFGLKKKKKVKKQSAPTQFNRFDYEQKYLRDPFGQERAENARVWLTYLDEAESYDRDKVDGWKDTVDVLLVFAGLFSAVVTTFLSQTSQSLQQNSTQVSASLLYEIAQLQRAQLTGASIADIPNSPLTPNTPFKPSINASLVNGLWISSLTTSLCAALFAVLTKQWLFYYQSPVPGTARDKVRVRQFRFEGLEKWKVALIIDLLPVLLHFSLGLFLIGLVVFILPLDIRIVWIIIVLSGFTYILYLVSIILPIWYPQCPYATPLTIYVGFIIQSLRSIHFRLPSFDHIYLTRLSIYRDQFLSGPSLGFRHSLQLVGPTVSKTTTRIWNFLKARVTTFIILPSSMNWKETQLEQSIEEAAAMLEDNALFWLSSTSSNPAVSRIISRSVSKSPNFDKQSDLYYQLAHSVYKPQFTKEWDENSLRLLLDDSEFFEDLYHALHLIVLCGLASLRFGPKVLYIIQRGPTSFLEDIKESYPELFSIIIILEKDEVEALLTGLRDNSLKLHEDIWLCLLERARADKELASQIISSGTFNLFRWYDAPLQIHCNEVIPLAKELPPDLGPMGFLPEDLSSFELNRSGFSYLFRYFFGECLPDGNSFESRYLLFIEIYRNLISDDPLIVDGMLRQRTLIYFLLTFIDQPFLRFWWIQNQVIDATFVNRLWRDLLPHISVFDNNMSLDVQITTVRCFEVFERYCMRNSGDFSLFFTTQTKEELQFIYRWCSNVTVPCGVQLVQRLFMPGNLSNLCMLLLEDRDHAKSNFSNCLELLLRSPGTFVSWKHKILYEEYIIPNVIHLFTATIPSDDSNPLFSILYDPSVLAQAWLLLAMSPSDPRSYLRLGITIPSFTMDRSRAVLAMLPSRLGSDSLKEIYDLMIGCMEKMCLDMRSSYNPPFGRLKGPILIQRACISAYTFGRMAGLIVDPNTFNLPSSVISKAGFEDITDMRNELERQFMEEKRKQSHSSLSKFLRITRTFQTLWRKESDTTETETGMELRPAVMPV